MPDPNDWTLVQSAVQATTPSAPGWTLVKPAPTFKGENEKDAQGNAVVRGVSGAWNWLNTPLVPHIADAAHAIADHIDAPMQDRSRTVAQIRGFLAGATEGAGNVLSSFTSPVGIALSLAGLGEDSAIVRNVPALKSLLALPEVKTLQRTVQAVSGAGFTAAGTSQLMTAPNAAGKAQGAAQIAAGLLGTTSAIRSRTAPAIAQSRLTPEDIQSNQFAEANAIPLDAATATGSPVARGLQKVVSNTILGERVTAPFAREQQAALGRTGAELATQVNGSEVTNSLGTSIRPGAAITSEQAGQGISDAVRGVMADLNTKATNAYERLRNMEDQQAQTIALTGGIKAPFPNATNAAFTTVPLAVNVGKAKAALTPLYARLSREAQLVPLMGDKARALTALDRLMNGPDLAPLSAVDAALGDLKALARTDIPELRTQGQGAAATAVQALNSQVLTTAAKAGHPVIQALQEGRAATTQKYQTADVFDQLRNEPVQLFRQMTAPKDSGIQLLRQVQSIAPDRLPDVGRAQLDDLLSLATERGGFDHADKLYADWQKIGPETKSILFGNLRPQLDHFFLLAKRTAENPNPSGTAHTLSIGAQGAMLWTNPLLAIKVQIGSYGLAKLLYSQQGVRALTKLMATTRPSASTLATAAQTAGWAEVVSAARSVGLPLALPDITSNTPGEEQP